jgi:ornithine decarboxylase
MINRRLLKKLAEQHGTPLFVVDHDQLRRNYAQFKRYLPRVQAYYAVKANSDPAIVKTFYDAGGSFDVASMPEFMIVHEYIKDLPDKERQAWIWKKIKKFAPLAGLALRIKVPNTGAMVELSSKFGAAPGEAVDMILAADKAGLVVEGLSFHVGSQTTNFQNYVAALSLAANLFKEARDRGYTKMNLLDIGGGFPAPYDDSVKPFRELASLINRELDRLFPKNIQILAEPGRFMVATAAIAVSKIIGKAVREGKLCYYINDGVYHTFSGVIFDHCHYHLKAFKRGPTEICSVFGPTCDALDVVSMAEQLPSDLERGDFLYSENIGAYSHASSTWFNGFAPAKVVHVNQ